MYNLLLLILVLLGGNKWEIYFGFLHTTKGSLWFRYVLATLASSFACPRLEDVITNLHSTACCLSAFAHFWSPSLPLSIFLSFYPFFFSFHSETLLKSRGISDFNNNVLQKSSLCVEDINISNEKSCGTSLDLFSVPGFWLWIPVSLNLIYFYYHLSIYLSIYLSICLSRSSKVYHIRKNWELELHNFFLSTDDFTRGNDPSGRYEDLLQWESCNLLLSRWFSLSFRRLGDIVKIDFFSTRGYHDIFSPLFLGCAKKAEVGRMQKRGEGRVSGPETKESCR